jgi:hypothetical protein
MCDMEEEIRHPDRPIDRALRWAKSLHMGESAFAKALGVSPQRVTNWKRRGMPARFHPDAARITRHTIQQLLGEHAEGSSIPREPEWPFAIPRSDFDLLDERQKQIIELAIKRFVEGARMKALGAGELLDQITAAVDRKPRRRKRRAA